MVKNKRKLSVDEWGVLASHWAGIHFPGPKTHKQFCIAMVGLVGSGKSTVARELAERFGAVLISADDIRIELKKKKIGYDKVWAIVEELAHKVMAKGWSVVIDSDFVDAKKRASIREKLKEHVPPFFVRTTCDLEVMFQRIREHDPGEFFNTASTSSMSIDRGKDVKLRELMRRLPLHYLWKNKDGGVLNLKSMPFITHQIDTTTEKTTKEGFSNVFISIGAWAS